MLALMMSNLGRFATDLYVWHSFEFGFLEVADGLAGTSSIMPQKEPPLPGTGQGGSPARPSAGCRWSRAASAARSPPTSTTSMATTP